MNENALRQHIESAWSDRSLIQTEEVRGAVAEVMAQLDRGALRVAHPEADGTWTVNEWVKQAVLLNFPIQTMETVEVGPFEFHDKMPLKRLRRGGRSRGASRCGALRRTRAPDCILMPSYVNLGAYVGERTMVDTGPRWDPAPKLARMFTSVVEWALGGPRAPSSGAGDCGGRRVHRLTLHVVEGVRVGKEAVLGANVVLTASTPIVDVRARPLLKRAAQSHHGRSSFLGPVPRPSPRAPTKCRVP